MTVEEFPYGSPVYAASCELRRRFLREAIGLKLTEADVRDDAEQHHYGLFDARRELIGSLVGKPRPDLGEGVAQIRQVVVHEQLRERGHGSKLMREAERLLAERGFTRLVLFARAESASFYERCGYQPVGEVVELIGIDHQRMEKRVWG